MPRQLEIADDLGAQQAHDIGKDGEPERREDLFTACGTADDVASFEHEHALAGTSKVGRADEPVVARADNDGS